MANQARVTSTDALESFRASLIVFLTKARRAIDDASESVRRTRQWLQQDQRMYWEGELRRRRKALERAEQELMSARIAEHRESALMNRQMAVNQAQRAIAEAEAKMRRVKSWTQNFDHSADPIVKKLESLRQVLDQDMPKAIAYLSNVQRILEAYTDSPAPIAGSVPSAEPASAPAPETGGQP
jgi:DNA repair exonuclease SbcCD ATPase subunit